MLSDLTGGANRAFKATGLTVNDLLAAHGAALGTLAGWGIEQQRSRGAQSTMPAERPRYAEAA